MHKQVVKTLAASVMVFVVALAWASNDKAQTEHQPVKSTQKITKKDNKDTKTTKPMSLVALGGGDDSVNNSNSLTRAHVGQTELTSVDPYSGVLSYNIPIINIPENDGVNLHFSLNSHSVSQGLTCPSYGGGLSCGYMSAGISRTNFDLVPVVTFDMKNPVASYTDFYGYNHTFIKSDQASSQTLTYFSKDRLKTVFHRLADGSIWYYIYTPKGIQYKMIHIDRFPLQAYEMPFYLKQVISPNGGTVIDYTYKNSNGFVSLSSITDHRGNTLNFIYNASGTLQSINLNNKEVWGISSSILYTTVFHNNIYKINSITYPDGSKLQLQYSDKPSTGYYYPLKSIVYPDGGKSSFTYDGYRVTSQINSGPGVTSGTWKYNYIYPGGNTVTTVSGPDKKQIFNFDGTFPGSSEWSSGLLISKKLYSADGKILYQMTNKTWQSYTIPDSSLQAPELTKQVISRGGDCKTQSCMEYITEFKDFDSYGYPKTEVESSVKHTV
ncbi:hypothetical protein [Piscirickettsia litoralis]|uniref:Sugar-binding protein n=1 Tax=Piscirickettsia litoralis TaxID=1891921 RepID=A0ABX3A6D4_9GAMM|nr:hypothetical protein [Piscirickettsia litoralis]ODN43251.1 hypothetical protein BGC07_10395 [Piscirickettsia litoralis]